MKTLLVFIALLFALNGFSQCPTPTYNTIYVNTNAQNGAILDTIVACDPDFNTVMKWAITAGNTNYSAFRLVPISPLSCQFVLNNKNALAAYTSFKVTVRGTDNGSPVKYNSHIFNVLQKEPPIAICITQPTTHTDTISASTPNGTVLDSLWQCNQDGTAFAAVTWKIVSGNTNYSAFKIVAMPDGCKAVFSVANKNAFTKYASFTINIRGTYTGTSSYFTRIINVIIKP